MQERTEHPQQPQPAPFDKVARVVTTIACTLIAAFTAWIADAAYKTTLSLVALQRDMVYVDARITRVEKQVEENTRNLRIGGPR